MFILVKNVHRNMWTDINKFSECLYISNPEKCGSLYIHLYLLLTKHESTYLWRKTISTLTSSLSLCRKSLRKLDTLSSVIWPQTTICLERGKIQLSKMRQNNFWHAVKESSPQEIQTLLLTYTFDNNICQSFYNHSWLLPLPNALLPHIYKSGLTWHETSI